MSERHWRADCPYDPRNPSSVAETMEELAEAQVYAAAYGAAMVSDGHRCLKPQVWAASAVNDWRRFKANDWAEEKERREAAANSYREPAV